MSTVISLFEQAQLAEAAYANLIPGNSLLSELQNADNNMHFSTVQAADFVTHWRVVDHLPDDTADFSATLFESLDNPGHYIFAIRGSTSWMDAAANVDLAMGGLAFDQLLAMVNYVLRLQAGSTGLTRQVELLFGSSAQTLRTLPELQQGQIRLS